MASGDEDGGPAFPNQTADRVWDSGLTIRDWFAGQALAGLLANSDWSEDIAASSAFEYADAMLEARK